MSLIGTLFSETKNRKQVGHLQILRALDFAPIEISVAKNIAFLVRGNELFNLLAQFLDAFGT
jgi:hypothetical protein